MGVYWQNATRRYSHRPILPPWSDRPSRSPGFIMNQNRRTQRNVESTVHTSVEIKLSKKSSEIPHFRPPEKIPFPNENGYLWRPVCEYTFY